MASVGHYPWIVFSILNMASPASTVTGNLTATMEEVCLTETFRAQCPGTSVISVLSARYGRMRPNECDPVDRGNYGCVADVMEHMDHICSGKSECTIIVPDETLSALNPCERGYYPYLETSYICIPVISSSTYREACQNNGVLPLSWKSDVIIASSTVYSNAQDTGPCPLTIQAEAGQRINVSIVDFGHGRSTDAELSLQTTCHRYVVFTDIPMGIPRTVCRGMERDNNVFMSQTHQLNVQLSSTDGHDAAPNFLLQFSVVGCAGPELNGNELTERSPESAMLHCRSTGESQYMVCDEMEWNATVQSCDAVTGAVSESWSPIQGLMIILVVGIFIGMLIACMLMCCIWFCMKIRKSTRPPPRQIVYYEGTSQWNAARPIEGREVNQETCMIMDDGTVARRKKRDYGPVEHGTMMVRTMERPRQPDKVNRNIFDELPPIPPHANVAPKRDDEDDDEYAKPV